MLDAKLGQGQDSADRQSQERVCLSSCWPASVSQTRASQGRDTLNLCDTTHRPTSSLGVPQYHHHQQSSVGVARQASHKTPPRNAQSQRREAHPCTSPCQLWRGRGASWSHKERRRAVSCGCHSHIHILRNMCVAAQASCCFMVLHAAPTATAVLCPHQHMHQQTHESQKKHAPYPLRFAQAPAQQTSILSCAVALLG